MTVTVNRCAPAATVTETPDAHENAAPPSSEQLVLVTVPVVVHATRATALYGQGALVMVIVGAVEIAVLATVQARVAVALPPELLTVTRNVCVPAASAL